MADLITACKHSKMTSALEGGLIGYITLFKYVITFLSTNTLKDLIQVSKIKYNLSQQIAIKLINSTIHF